MTIRLMCRQVSWRGFAQIRVDSRFVIPFKEGESVLEACERNSVFMKADCRRGECKLCAVDARTMDSAEWTEVC